MNRYQEISAQFYGSRMLFGNPADAGVVAVEIAGPNEVEVIRRVAGALVRERKPLKLFALLASRELLNGLRIPHETIELAGDFHLRYLVTVSSTDALDALRAHLRETTGKSPNALDAPYLILADQIEQYLMLTGTTFFMGLQFGDLRRLQLDIETYISPGFEFPSAARAGDRIDAIALTESSGFEAVLNGKEMDEPAMLREMVRGVCSSYAPLDTVRALEDVMRTRTSIVIAHRVSTIQDADVIVVVDDGRVVELGDHASLLAHDGLYADLFRHQRLEEEIAEL
jgi:hypothetical protein